MSVDTLRLIGHRYDFDNDAVDAIGTMNGSLTTDNAPQTHWMHHCFSLESIMMRRRK